MSNELTAAPAELAQLADGVNAEHLRDRLAHLGEGDPEAGHSIADQLAEATLRAIADGHPDPATLARDVLVILSAEFPRWYA